MGKSRIQRVTGALLCAWLGWIPWVACAEVLAVQVGEGTRPIDGAVVSLHSEAAAAATSAGVAQIDQREGQFVPRLLAITRGTRVDFPNSDRIRHHVYSFSEIKRFQLPLYAGHPAQPIEFDRTGVAVLGCNIHDWMIAFVVVLDSPYFAISDVDGVARLEAPPGEYELQVWHERLAPGQALRRPVQVASGLSDAAVAVQLELLPPAPARARAARAPTSTPAPDLRED